MELIEMVKKYMVMA